MNGRNIRLWHISPCENRESIERGGLKAGFDGRVWFIARERDIAEMRDNVEVETDLWEIEVPDGEEGSVREGLEAAVVLAGHYAFHNGDLPTHWEIKRRNR